MTPTTTAPCMLKGSSVYTTKTTNRKKGTWGQDVVRFRTQPRLSGCRARSLLSPRGGPRNLNPEPLSSQARPPGALCLQEVPSTPLRDETW